MSEQNPNSECLHWGPQHPAHAQDWTKAAMEKIIRSCLAPFEGQQNTVETREEAARRIEEEKKILLQQMIDDCLATLKDKRGIQNYVVTCPGVAHAFRIEDTRNRCRVRMFTEDGKLVHTVILRGRRKAKKTARSFLGSFFVEYEVWPARPVYTITCTPIAPVPEA